MGIASPHDPRMTPVGGARARAPGVARLEHGAQGPGPGNAPSPHRTWRRNEPREALIRIARGVWLAQTTLCSYNPERAENSVRRWPCASN
jgi:hypothetical protein